MSAESMNRRRFLRRASMGAAVLSSGALADGRALGANDRLAIGMIGVGDRGSELLNQIIRLAKSHNAEVTAVCDVWRRNLDKAAQRVEEAMGRRPRTSTRYGDLLALEDLDAVVIATPDFGHAPILIEALQAGKDAYVEKPMAIEIAGANRALELARSGNRIVQAGTQYRSHGGYAAAARELAGGAIGQVSRVRASANFNEARWARSYAGCTESDVDWEAYLLNRAKRPFDPKLLRRWHLYREFTNGVAGLWMTHYADAVHLLTGASYPTSAVALGGVYVWKDGREHADTFHAVLEYREGFLFDWSMSLGNSAGTDFAVYGTRGTLHVGSDYAHPREVRLSSAGAARGTAGHTKTLQADPSQDHMANWLECIRSRRPPNADVRFGHQHAVATILAATAMETGRRQKYDPQKRVMYAG